MNLQLMIVTNVLKLIHKMNFLILLKVIKKKKLILGLILKEMNKPELAIIEYDKAL